MHTAPTHKKSRGGFVLATSTSRCANRLVMARSFLWACPYKRGERIELTPGEIKNPPCGGWGCEWYENVMGQQMRSMPLNGGVQPPASAAKRVGWKRVLGGQPLGFDQVAGGFFNQLRKAIRVRPQSSSCNSRSFHQGGSHPKARS